MTQLALLPEDITLEQTFADWGPSYDAMIEDLERERLALEDTERDDEAQTVPEFLPLGGRRNEDRDWADGGL